MAVHRHTEQARDPARNGQAARGPNSLDGMAEVLVTGGTGVVGTEVVSRLLERDADVRILSRRARPEVPAGVDSVRGDLDSGAGLEEAVRGVDAVVHCASATELPTYRAAKRVDVEGTRRLVEAARASGEPRIVHISIVGIDRIPLGYYRAKLEAERVVESSGLPHAIQRTTQFHDLLLRTIRTANRVPFFLPVPKGFRVQPVDAGEAADRLVSHLETEPAGRAPDMGGPEVHTLTDLALSYLSLMGRRKPVVAIRTPGRASGAFREGHNLCVEHPDGRARWEDWLRHRLHEETAAEKPAGAEEED